MWNTNDYQIDIVLIRHGQVPGNLEKRFVGITDESLTEEGREAIANRQYPEADMLFVSPLKRCTETANIIYPGLEPISVEEFSEIKFGAFEGKNDEELKDNVEYQEWIKSGRKKPFPGGESVTRFMLRVTRGMSSVLHMAIDEIESSGKKDKKITLAAVVHGGTIMAIQAYLGLSSFYDKMYDNAEYRCIGVDVKHDTTHDCITMQLRR